MRFLLIVTIIFTFIPRLLAEKFLAVSSYCQQYKKLNITLDTEAIKELSNNQYINKDFKNFDSPNKLDYFIRYFHISKGLCYYTEEEDIKEVNEIGMVEYNNDETNVHFMGELKYDKTVNCYYMYRKYMVPNQNVTLNPPCDYIYATFYNTMLYFLRNETLCPFPQEDDRVSLGSKEEVLKAREDYLVDLFNLYNDEIKGHNYVCEDKYNEEIFNCGYKTQLQKNNYCNNFGNVVDERNECCRYRSYFRQIVEINYDVPMQAVLSGVGTSVVLLTIGLCFSYFYTKEIKNQESLKKVLAAQEKMYSQNNLNNSRKPMMDNSSIPQSINYSDGGYNSNTNSTTTYQHQILSPDQQHSLPHSVDASISQSRAIRSPQPLPASPQDISNLRPNMNNTSLFAVSDRPSSIISSSSPNINPRAASLSNRPSSISSLGSFGVNPRGTSLSSATNLHSSSVDIAGYLSIPIEVPAAPSPEGPRPLSSRPITPRPHTPRPTTPVPHINSRPTTPHTSRPSTPHNSRPATPVTPTTPVTPRTPQTPSLPTTPNSLLPPLALTLPSEVDIPYIIDGTSTAVESSYRKNTMDTK